MLSEKPDLSHSDQICSIDSRKWGENGKPLARRMNVDPLIAESTLYSHHQNVDGLLDQVHNYVRLSHLPVTCILFISTQVVFSQFLPS